MAAYPRSELWKDTRRLVLVFANSTVTSLVADAVTDNVIARKACAAYIALVASVVNGVSIGQSWMCIGSENAPSESLLSLFSEVCNLAQAWGALFAVARYFSLPENDPFFTKSLLNAQAESLFEMSLVQSGTGWVAAVPTTFLERIVAWTAAYVGGILCTNMFLLSVVLSRRGYWDRDTLMPSTAAVKSVEAAVPVTRADWTVNFKR